MDNGQMSRVVRGELMRLQQQHHAGRPGGLVVNLEHY